MMRRLCSITKIIVLNVRDAARFIAATIALDHFTEKVIVCLRHLQSTLY
jgi:hypothetical protein